MSQPDWILAHQATVSINGVSRPVNDAECTEDFGEVDFTNLTSPTDTASGCLSYEMKCDVVKRGLRGSMFVDRLAVANFTGGTQYPGSLSVTGEEAISGTVTITQRGKKIATKGGYVISFQGSFTGTVTVA